MPEEEKVWLVYLSFDFDEYREFRKLLDEKIKTEETLGNRDNVFIDLKKQCDELDEKIKEAQDKKCKNCVNKEFEIKVYEGKL